MKIYLCSAILGTVCYLLAAVAAPQFAALSSPAPKPENDLVPEDPGPAGNPGTQPSPARSEGPSNAEMVQHLMNDEALARKLSERTEDNAADSESATERGGGSRLDSDYDLGKRK